MTPHAALVLVATPIGNLADLTPRAVRELAGADLIAAEDTRRARKLLSHADIRGGDRLVAVHEHNETQMSRRIVEEITAGKRVVYVSDAGTPAVADPGERLVRACLRAGLHVEAVPGPSAVLTALVVSGLPTERFVFEGFLPRKGKLRTQRLEALAQEERTAILFESPHRVVATLEELAQVLGPDRPVAVVRELTKLHEEAWRGRLGDAAAGVGDARGEYVFVLGGVAVEAPAVEDEELERALEEALVEGASARDAAADVSARLGVPRRKAYAVAARVRERIEDAVD